MKIKVYNENGTIKVTKVSENGVEQEMFSSIQQGQIAEINISATTSFHAYLNGVSVQH